MNIKILNSARKLLSLAALAVVIAFAIPQGASAQTLFASDCSFGFKNVYFDNEPVCAVVQSGGGIFGINLVCVVPPGGQPADDVTPGGCNAVGIFLEEPLLVGHVCDFL